MRKEKELFEIINKFVTNDQDTNTDSDDNF